MPSRRGFKWDGPNGELELYVDGTLVTKYPNTAPGRATVTQATNHTTGVTCNGLSGTITLASVDLAAAAEAEFTVTNTAVEAEDVVVVCVGANNDASGTPVATVSDVADGSFQILLANLHATTAAFNDASTINFIVLKSGNTA